MEALSSAPSEPVHSIDLWKASKLCCVSYSEYPYLYAAAGRHWHAQTIVR